MFFEYGYSHDKLNYTTKEILMIKSFINRIKGNIPTNAESIEYIKNHFIKCDSDINTLVIHSVEVDYSENIKIVSFSIDEYKEYVFALWNLNDGSIYGEW